MRAKLQQWAYAIRGSYWFVPALMALAAIVLSQVTVRLDHSYGADWMTDSEWVTLNQPEGARALLATVAGSMITVTGVTFSLTILAVSYATSHFGPRLLDNFMHDRGNQFTLGTFVATFLYCLMVLRSVRTGSDQGITTTMFVPHISVLVAIGLTVTSVGVLIYFIHHIPESINISNVLDRISQQVATKIEEIYPEESDQSATKIEPADDTDQPVVPSPRSGYLQGIDERELMDFTTQSNAVVELLVEPGDFLLRGQPIARVRCKAAEAECKKLASSFAIGRSRTPTQDIHFLLHQFVEVAARALSPGVNDPFTAIQCIDQLGRAMINFSHRKLPPRYLRDDAGTVRVINVETSWQNIVDRSWGQLLPYAKDDCNVLQHLKKTIHQVVKTSANPDLNQALNNLPT